MSGDHSFFRAAAINHHRGAQKIHPYRAMPTLAMGMKGSPSTKSRGVTLIEIMLVLALVAVIVSFSWPAISKSLSNHRLRKAADIVRTQWSKARIKAMTGDRIVLFRYEMEGRRFRIEQLANEDSLEGMADEEAMLDQPAATGKTPLYPNDPSRASSSGTSNIIDFASGSVQTLPDGIVFRGCQVENDSRSLTIAVDVGQASNLSSDKSWSDPIYFYPDGTSSGAWLRLCNDKNRSLELTLRGMTGVAKVGEINAEGVIP